MKRGRCSDRCRMTRSRSLRAARTRKIVQRQHDQGGGKHERKSLLRGSSRGSKIRRRLWLRPCHRNILYCQPFDTLGNHRRHFRLAVCDLLRAVSVIINAPLMTGHPNAAAPASALALSRNATRALNMLRENANNVAFDVRNFVEQVGGYSLDSVAMGHKLRLPRDAWRTLCLRENIHRGITDLALHDFAVAHHRKR